MADTGKIATGGFSAGAIKYVALEGFVPNPSVGALVPCVVSLGFGTNAIPKITLLGFATNASGGVASSLNAAAGTYAVTGVDFANQSALNLNAAPGAYAVTGLNVGLSLNGGGVSLELNAAPGSYVVSGADATLVTVAAGVFSLDCEPGSYLVTGAPSIFRFQTAIFASAENTFHVSAGVPPWVAP